MLQTAMPKLFVPAVRQDCLRRFAYRSAAFGVLVAFATCSYGVQPSDQLLPTNTRGYISIQDFASFEAKWEQTSFGRMSQDPILEAFMKDLEEQVKSRLDEAGVRLGLSFEDVVGVCGGEVAFAAIEPQDLAQKHATAILVDVTGKEQELEKLLATIDQSMGQRNADKKLVQRNGIELRIYEVPSRRNPKITFNAILFTHENQLFATDHLEVAEHLVSRALGKASPSLAADVPAYEITQRRARQDLNGAVPDVVGFMEPLGYARVSREAVGPRKNRRADLLKALENQGFEALRGVGGIVNLVNGQHDAEFRAFVYAPPIPEAGDEKFRLAARVMAFPKAGVLAPEPWIPANVSSYHSAMWDIQTSYKYVDTLIDEVAGQEGFWDSFKESLKEDPNGPMIDLDKDIVAHLGERVTVFSDVVEPLSPQSERGVVAISLSNPQAMRKSIDRMMEEDPATELHELDGHRIWEIIPETEDDFSVAAFEDDFAGFGDEEFGEEAGAEEAPFLTSAAISVVNGHLLIASHVDLVMDIIQHPADAPSLTQEADFQRVNQALVQLGAGDGDTARSFARLDALARVSYELVRQGQMPDSEGMLGKVLNRLFVSEEKGTKRTQQIDGKNLPPFKEVEKYFGTAGVFIQSENDGLYVSGAALAAQTPSAAEGTDNTSISTAKTASETTDK